MNQPNLLIEFLQATIRRGDCHLMDWNWTLRAGEAWAIHGPTGSGKTTLLECLAGTMRIHDGILNRHIASSELQFVAFKEQSRAFSYSGQYYQQRFEFADVDQPLTLRQYLKQSRNFDSTQLLPVIRALDLEDRLDLSFMKLSNGQTRRARIARAILANPSLLILDDPLVGLDVSGRHSILEMLQSRVQMGLCVVLTARPDEIPKWFRVLNLDSSRSASDERRSKPSNHRHSSSKPILELNHVTVRHGGIEILRDVSWTVRSGERWAIVGPNGAGKTTLLALACGDHPQAFSNDVRLFGQRRGQGETIWDVKKRIGFVSPEFHLYFSEPLTAFEAAATGFHDALLYRAPSPAEARVVHELFETFGASTWKDRPFRQLPTGQQRLALVIRALVKRPELLILDEPFQGMDVSTALSIRDWLDENLEPNQTLIFVTHRPDEIPRTVSQTLKLSAGQRIP